MIEWKLQLQKLHRFDFKTTQKRPRGKLVDILLILKVEFTSELPRRINVIISMSIHLSNLMKSRKVEFRRRIDGESTKIVHWNEKDNPHYNGIKYHSETTLLQLCSKFFLNNYEALWQRHLKDTLQLKILGEWVNIGANFFMSRYV